MNEAALETTELGWAHAHPQRIGTGTDGQSVDLYGPGRVGRAFCRLLAKRGSAPRRIIARSGILCGDDKGGPPGIVIDCTSPRYGAEGDDWVDALAAHLEQGTHLVTCNKAPLARAWSRLHKAADAGGARILESATVGGGTPILPFVRRLDATLGVTQIEVCASGTLGYVFDQIGAGATLENAVASAQKAGYAEPDPTLDLEGTDLAAKAVLLHNALQGAPVRSLVVDDAPFLTVDEHAVRTIAKAGGVPRAVAAVSRGRVEVRFQPADWARGEPVDAVVRVTTNDGARFLLRGPGAGPEVTAANLLADLDLLREVNDFAPSS